MLNKIKMWLVWFRTRRARKNIEKMRISINRAKEEMPELFLTSVGEKINLREGMRAYHDIKGIKSQRFNNWLMSFLTGIIVILTILQIMTSISINESNKIYMQTIRPNLSIFPQLSDNNKLPIIDRDRISSINLDNSTGLLFNFQVTNTGKMESGSVRITVMNNWSSERGFTSGYTTFDNIPSGKTKGNSILLTTIECHKWKTFRGVNITDCRFSENNVPLGIHPLELKIECDSCYPQISYVNITACFNNYKYNNCSN